MTLIVDTAPLVALADPRDPRRRVLADVLQRERGELVIPAPVTAEADYLIGERVGRLLRRELLTDMAMGRFNVACLDRAEYDVVLRYDEQYADLDVGLADLSVVVLAHRFRTRRILTFDQRHFRALRPLDGGSFVLLPEDEP